MRLAIAIDPGDHATGIAVFVAPDPPTPPGPHGGFALVASCSVQIPDQVAALAFLRKSFRESSINLTACPPAGWEVVIERDTCPRSRAAIESLAACRRTWRTSLRRLKVPNESIREIAPQTWQGPCGLLGKMAKLVGGTKAASMLRAADVLGNGRTPGDADEADAINLGAWWLREGGLAGQLSREAGRRVNGTSGKKGDQGRGRQSSGAAWEAFARERGLI